MPKADRGRLQQSLAGFIAEKEGLGPDSVRVKELSRLAGGASRLLSSCAVEIDRAGAGIERLEIVLRQDPPGRVSPGGMELEFSLLESAARSGVPVPRVHWCSGDEAVLGSPFYAMDRVVGEAIPRRLLRDEAYAATRANMTQQLGSILARIHSIDTGEPALRFGLAAPEPGVSPAAAELERLGQGYRALAVEPHPVLDLADRWLRERSPPAPQTTLVHGDYRVGNVMFDETGIQAILDWELAHVGDPIEDLGWLCVRAWRFGNDSLAVGGVGTREELVEAYESAGGAQVDPQALRFWEACGNYKLALVFITQARAYLDGAHPTVELASLGRRIAEPEAELLRLMEEAG